MRPGHTVGKACLLIRKHDHFTPAREMRRDVRALTARNHPFRSFRFFELPTEADTGTGSVERPCFLHPEGRYYPMKRHALMVGQTSTCLTQSTLGPYVVCVWPRDVRKSEPTKPSDSTVWLKAAAETRRARAGSSLIKHKVLIKWFLSSQFTYKIVNLLFAIPCYEIQLTILWVN